MTGYPTWWNWTSSGWLEQVPVLYIDESVLTVWVSSQWWAVMLCANRSRGRLARCPCWTSDCDASRKDTPTTHHSRETTVTWYLVLRCCSCFHSHLQTIVVYIMKYLRYYGQYEKHMHNNYNCIHRIIWDFYTLYHVSLQSQQLQNPGFSVALPCQGQVESKSNELSYAYGPQRQQHSTGSIVSSQLFFNHFYFNPTVCKCFFSV